MNTWIKFSLVLSCCTLGSEVGQAADKSPAQTSAAPIHEAAPIANSTNERLRLAAVNAHPGNNLSPAGQSSISAEAKIAQQTLTLLEVTYRIAAPTTLDGSRAAKHEPLPWCEVHLDTIAAHLRTLEAQSQILKNENLWDDATAARVRVIHNRILNWNR